MTHQTKAELLADLESRLERAAAQLKSLAESGEALSGRKRLLAKRDGVDLALSYVREIPR